jgi:hypothetical protein
MLNLYTPFHWRQRRIGYFDLEPDIRCTLLWLSPQHSDKDNKLCIRSESEVCWSFTPWWRYSIVIQKGDVKFSNLSVYVIHDRIQMLIIVTLPLMLLMPIRKSYFWTNYCNGLYGLWIGTKLQLFMTSIKSWPVMSYNVSTNKRSLHFLCSSRKRVSAHAHSFISISKYRTINVNMNWNIIFNILTFLRK